MAAKRARTGPLWTHRPGVQEAWLALTTEDILEPELEIVDPHHHLFFPTTPSDERATHPNIARYLVEELSADVNTGHNVKATVHVQCYVMYRETGPAHLRYAGETEFAQGVAAVGEAGLLGPTRLCAGIVASADHCSGAKEMTELLAAHRAAGRNFRGIRFLGGRAHEIPFKEPVFREGFSVIVEHGLPIDIGGPEAHHPLDFRGVLSGIAELAEAFPNATIVVCHCGGLVGPIAFQGEGGSVLFDVWKAQISRLSRLPNVYMKLGGLLMPNAGHGLELREVPVGSEEAAELMLPYIGHCLDHFGADRCMFESNFPMDKCSVSYHVLWNAFKRIAAKRGMTAAEKAAAFSGTAKRVYKLEIAAPQH